MLETRLTARQKQAVSERAAGRCEYCLSPASHAPDPFSVEHIHPRSKGGHSRLSNLALSCQGCNNRKYTSTEAVDPASGEWVLLYHPRRHRWRDHFTWNRDLTLMIGVTPIGRATIEKLKLNRTGVVNLRTALLLVGAHLTPETIGEA